VTGESGIFASIKLDHAQYARRAAFWIQDSRVVHVLDVDHGSEIYHVPAWGYLRLPATPRLGMSLSRAMPGGGSRDNKPGG
jgi:hypothetical protein